MRLGGAAFVVRDHGFTDTRLIAKLRFNFGRFYAEAANFHLLVDAAEKFERAIFTPTCAVAGAVNPGSLVQLKMDRLQNVQR